MLLKHIRKNFNMKELKEDFRSIGINFVTAGFVGIFINHYVGLQFSIMFWASVWITSCGGLFLSMVLLERNKS